MKLLGVVLVLAGGLIPAVSVTITQSMGARLILTLVGITLALVGVLGVLNPVHQKTAVWRRN